MEPALEEGPGLVPRHFVVETVADQPDELTGQLRGVADHFLCRHAVFLRSFLAAAALLAGDFLLRAAGLLQRDEQEREQVVRERGEVGLRGGGRLAIGPGLLLMQLVFEHVENLFDLPPEQIQ